MRVSYGSTRRARCTCFGRRLSRACVAGFPLSVLRSARSVPRFLPGRRRLVLPYGSHQTCRQESAVAGFAVAGGRSVD